MIRTWKGKGILFAVMAYVMAVGLSLSFAGDFSKDAFGTTGGQFLELPVGARGVAMGGAQGAATDDATAIYYNPAALAGLETSNIALMHSIYLQSIAYDFLGIAIKTETHGVFGLGAQYLSPGSIERVDNTGNPTGDSISPRDIAVSMVNARKAGSLEYALGGKYISSRLNKTASSFAFDGGARWVAEPVAFSLSVSNLGSGLKYLEDSSPLPMTLRIGSRLLIGKFSMSLDGVAAKGAATYACAGLEYKSRSANSLNPALRIGYSGRTAAGKAGGLTGFSAGAGIEMKQFNFDYAFIPFGDLGNSHMLSLGFKFDRN